MHSPFASTMLGLALAAGVAAAAEPAAAARTAAPPVVLGLAARDAAKHDVEFQKYSRMLPVYREHGIQASLSATWPVRRPH
jgi:hypothetical protein